MASVKIYLDPHETEDEAHEMLLKALTHHADGGEHRQTFQQPAARAIFEAIEAEHETVWARILKEILAVIDQEV